MIIIVLAMVLAMACATLFGAFLGWCYLCYRVLKKRRADRKAGRQRRQRLHVNLGQGE